MSGQVLVRVPFLIQAGDDLRDDLSVLMDDEALAAAAAMLGRDVERHLAAWDDIAERVQEVVEHGRQA